MCINFILNLSRKNCGLIFFCNELKKTSPNKNNNNNNTAAVCCSYQKHEIKIINISYL